VRLLAAAICCLLLVVTFGALSAQTKEYAFDSFDVDITINGDGSFMVREHQTFSFKGGPFTYAYAEIPLDKVVEIVDISVDENGMPYRRSTSEGMPGTFAVMVQGKKLSVTWWYPPTSNARRSFTLAYLVRGGLRYYDGGDQLWWKAVSPEITVPVRSSRVLVHLPAMLSDSELRIASYGASAQISRPDPSTVSFTASDIQPGQGLEIRVQFPHGLVSGSPPPWQAEADRQAALEPYIALANLMLLLLGVLIGLGSIGSVFLLWFTHGRDRPAIVPATIIKDPPDDSPPALVGTLMDESLDIRDVVATLIDLARRGALSIEHLGQDWIFYKGDESAATHPFEKLMLMQLFGGAKSRRLSSQKEQFYAAMPRIEEEVFKELTSQGMFTENPRAVIGRFGCLGIGILVIAFISFWGATASGLWGAYALAVGLGILGLALLVVAPFMPQKTAKGTATVQRWKAFRNYLANISRYTDLQVAKDLFEKFLPYAIAFGLTKRWMDSFAAVGVPQPEWYLQRPRVYNRDYRYGTTGPETTGAGTRIPDLQRSSDALASGLQSMSNSLMDLLNTASHVFSTRPDSARSSGGWSGGGFGGGGRGGGGGGGGGGRGAG
jgi:uncharacterized membrane protein YgcG